MKHHKIAVKYSEKVDYEKAKLHYEIAKEYRERSLKAKKGEK